MKARFTYSIIAVSIAITACAKPDAPPPQTKTKAQKDSAIANSGLPGAQGVAKAMKAADSARAHQAAIDSIKP